MPANESCAADDVAGSSGSDGHWSAGCSCLPFCFWKSRQSRGPERRRRRRRFRLRLSWFTWPWLRKSSRGGSKQLQEDDAGGETKKKRAAAGKRRRRLILLLLAASLHTKKALAPVSSGGSLLAKVSSLGGAKKKNRSKPRRTVDDDDAAPTTSCARETAAPGAIVSPRPGGGMWRAPSSSRFHPLQPDRGGAEPDAGGLWTAATTLGMIVFFGRVTAVIFLCSCLYGARWLGAALARAGAWEVRANIVGAGGSSRRLGDQVAVELCTEEYKKKVIMDGLLDRAAGKRPSSRFCK